MVSLRQSKRFRCAIFFLVCLLLKTCLVFLLFYVLAVPRPPQHAVVAVLGADPRTAPDRGMDDADFITIIGHRGAGLDAPENSLAAIKNCHAHGCRMVEFDVALSADEVAVLFHDDTVDRVTGGSGPVSEKTWTELQQLDISDKHQMHGQYAGERIPRFADAVKLCLELDLRMIIDLKNANNKMVQEVVDMFKKHPALYSRAMVSSFSPFTIYKIRWKEPRIVCSLAYYPSKTPCEEDSANPCEHTFMSRVRNTLASAEDVVYKALYDHVIYRMLGLSAVLLYHDVITEKEVQYWDDQSLRVVAWTVNEPQEKTRIHHMRIAYITDTLTNV